MPEGFPSETELFAKAEDIALGSQNIGKLSTHEIKLMKQYGFDKKNIGIAVAQ
jgi:hypothetical protein